MGKGVSMENKQNLPATGLYKKLLEAQRKIGAIAKDSTNPFFHSKYFDINGVLEVVKPILNEQGIIVIQPLDGDKLKTILIDAETGETMESIINLTINPDPQKMGSAITYFRRYSLQSFLALQAEDDDAETASAPHRVVTPAKPPVTGKAIASGLAQASAPKITKTQIENLNLLYAQAKIPTKNGAPMLTGLFLKDKTANLTGAEATQLINWLKDLHEGKNNAKKDDAGVIIAFEYPTESEGD